MSDWTFETRKRYDLTLADCDYPEWSGRPARTILLCSEQRSGSTLLGEALYFAGGLGCPLEYFHAGFRPDFEGRWATGSADAYLDAAHRHRTAPSGVFSAKLFWSDILDLLGERDSALRAEVAESVPDKAPAALYRRIAATLGSLLDGASYVHLRRVDRVRGAVSGFIAGETGLWRAIPGVGESTPLKEPTFDFERIAARLASADQAHAHWAKLFVALGVVPVAVTYEALMHDYDGTIRTVLRALGSDAGIPVPRMKRQSDARSDAFAWRFLCEAQARFIASGAA